MDHGRGDHHPIMDEAIKRWIMDKAIMDKGQGNQVQGPEAAQVLKLTHGWYSTWGGGGVAGCCEAGTRQTWDTGSSRSNTRGKSGEAYLHVHV
jgi:hypothetical protein